MARAQRRVPKVALTIQEVWLQKILEGSKSWELRGCRCIKHLGQRIALAQSGLGMLVGEATIGECFNVTDVLWEPANMSKHQVQDRCLVKYCPVYAWTLQDVVRYSEPRPYKRPPGAISWVSLEKSTSKAARTRCRRRTKARQGGLSF